MEHPGFFDRAGPYPLAEVAAATGAELAEGADPSAMIDDVRPLSEAGRSNVAFVDNIKYLPQLATTAAGACLVVPALAARVPATTAALVTKQPYHGFARALTLFYPSALQPMAATPGAPPIDPTARLEDGVLIEPGAVIGREAQIGAGTRIAAGAVIGARVTIGRNCYIGALATITHALVGDRVLIHSGVRIGQDGFGFAMGPGGHLKVPQIGRVIIQDDVEIGANTTIDRGALKDTMIGEGTKIDNLVQIGAQRRCRPALHHRFNVRHLRFDGTRRLRRHGRSIRNRRSHQNRQRRSSWWRVASDARCAGRRQILRHSGEDAARGRTRAGLDQAARGARQGQL